MRRATRWVKRRFGALLAGAAAWAGLMEAPKWVVGSLLFGGLVLESVGFVRKRLNKRPARDPFGNPIPTSSGASARAPRLS
jgi:hypothetical protein